MTLYWIVNPCALASNTIYNNWSAIGYRKALFTQLFFVFLIYFISQTLYTFIFNNTTQRTNSLKKNNQVNLVQSSKNQNQLNQFQNKQNNNNKQQVNRQLPWHDKKWNRDFTIIYSNHCIALGLCILFSPFQGAVAIAYFHFFAYLTYVLFQLIHKQLLAKISRIVLDIFNLILILIGLIGINYSTCSSTLQNMCQNGSQIDGSIC